jgi:hypothetical protein
VVSPEPFPSTGAIATEDGRRFQAVRLIGVVASVLIALVVVGKVLSTWSDWHSYLIVKDYLDGVSGVTDDLVGADTFTVLTSWLTVVLLPAAGIVFTMWLWRVRVNSELLSTAPHRHQRGFAIASNFIPIVNLWVPRRVVLDVWRATRPTASSALVNWWWAAFITAGVVDRIASRLYLRDDVTAENFRDVAATSTAATIAYTAAGVLVILVIHRLSTWQSQPVLPEARAGAGAVPVYRSPSPGIPQHHADFTNPADWQRPH